MTRDRIDSIRQDRQALEGALAGLGARISGRSCTCPWHDDQSPSASIIQGADGAWRLYCHVCDRAGDVFDLREQAGGRSVAEQLRELSNESTPRPTMQTSTPRIYPDLAAVRASLAGMGELEAAYEYAHPITGDVELAVLRIRLPDGRKTFRQASPCPGGWKQEGPSRPWPLYNRSAIIAADRVVVVEGEKCVDTLRAIGIAATTAPCGAGKADHADWSSLSDKIVVLWPDYDDTGAKHMQDVRRILEALPNPPRLSIVDPVGLCLAPKGDVADFLEKFDAQDSATVRGIVAGCLTTPGRLERAPTWRASWRTPFQESGRRSAGRGRS